MAEPKFWLVIVGDSDDPECVEIANQEELTKVVRERVLDASEPLWAYLFHGDKLTIQNPIASCSIKGAGIDLEVDGVGGGKSTKDKFTPLRYVRDVNFDPDGPPPAAKDAGE